MMRWLGPSLALLATSSLAQAQDLVIDGEVPADGEHFYIPFEVPAGVVELEVRHDDQSEANILDWGLYQPDGEFRGYGGGNTEPAIVGLEAASRSYIPGPIPAGTWNVHAGKAKIDEPPGTYHIEIFFRDAATLAPQPERAPYAPVPALSGEARWYAGDFHVHSDESGDAKAPLGEVASFAAGRGMDFIALSEHNTLTSQDFFAAVQAEAPTLLLMPNVELTTYQGHANGIGVTTWIDPKIGLDGVTLGGIADAVGEQDALFSINHPALDLGDLCIGCAWKHELPAQLDAVEIATGGWSQSGFLFGEDAIAFWDDICASGRHVAAIGGSDDHRGGQDLGMFDSPVGDPTTMVYAEELSAAGILEGVRNGRTVVKLQGPDDPMIELLPNVAPEGDTIAAQSVTVTAKVSGGAGHVFRFVLDGTPTGEQPIESDPFEASIQLVGGASEQRLRAEVWVDDAPRTVTSHVWVVVGAGMEPVVAGPTSDGGCGCQVPGDRDRHGRHGAVVAALLLAVGLTRRGLVRARRHR